MSAEPDTLDLEHGRREPEPEKPDRAGDAGERKRRRRGGDEPRGARSRRRNESELRGRLEAVFDRVAEALEGRGDDELAGVIRQDAGAMTGGLVSLTRPVAALRGPLLIALGIVEPALAFGRVLRILAGRWAARRERIAAERELAAPAGDEPGPELPPQPPL